MIRGLVTSIDDIIQPAKTQISSNVVWQEASVDLEHYIHRNEHKPAILWFTGLPGSGKSTVARALVKWLFEQHCAVVMLDGDNVRHGLCGDLGFSIEERSENIRRVGEVAKLFYQTGHVVVCTFISPLIEDRQLVRSMLDDQGFYEIYVKCDLDVCIRRDPKGLYAQALAGKISDFTGISSPYEIPASAEIVIETEVQSVEQCVERIFDQIQDIFLSRN
jgi:adenylyl-sulfate kinase